MTRAERARGYVEIANAALLEQDHVGALTNLALAEKEDSDIPQIYHVRALAYHHKGELKIAIEQAQKAINLLPEFPEANNTLGYLYIEAGEYEKALPPLTIAAENPLYAEAYKAHTNLGILYYRRGKDEAALAAFEKAIRESPEAACVAYYYRGHLRMKESRFDEAISSYDRATRRFCVSFSDAHLALGIVYEKTRQFEKARNKFLEIQQRYPNTTVADQAFKHLRYLP